MCAPRIGRADIEEASRAVNVSSRARQLCYPRGNFSVGSGSQIIDHRGSLCQCFHSASAFVTHTVRRPFAITLFDTFLPHLRSSLGASVIFSDAYRPSTTAHQHVSLYSRSVCSALTTGVPLFSPQYPEILLRRVPVTLCVKIGQTGADCSKALRGLLLPLGATGLFASI